MNTLLVTRTEQDARATRSTFVFGQMQGFILERAGAPYEPGAPVRIPAGTYGLELKPFDNERHSSKFDDAAIKIMAQYGRGVHRGMIRLRGVPDRNEILIHWGNFYSDSTGCLLVGMNQWKHDGFLAVGSSRVAYARFYADFAPVVAQGGAEIEIREQF